MRITTNGQPIPILHPDLHHSRLRKKNLLNHLDNPKDILAMNLFPLPKSIDHIVYKLLCHSFFFVNSDPIIRLLHADGIDIQIFKSRRRLRYLDGLFELDLPDQFLAFG